MKVVPTWQVTNALANFEFRKANRTRDLILCFCHIEVRIIERFRSFFVICFAAIVYFGGKSERWRFQVRLVVIPLTPETNSSTIQNVFVVLEYLMLSHMATGWLWLRRLTRQMQ
mmetsp:Transcript_103295/g.298787  ORF Transcript_103295/g.298787 Transcript_103295/m.298787 type:complete len:114 (-) Transcript_103295:560-901(-)